MLSSKSSFFDIKKALNSTKKPMKKSDKKRISKEDFPTFMQTFRAFIDYVFVTARSIFRIGYYIPTLVTIGLIALTFFINKADFPITQIMNDKQKIPMYAFDGRTKNPSWVMEMIKPSNTKQNLSSITFKEDLSIPSIMRPTLADYKDSGYTIAHLLDASEQKTSNKEFLLSTTSPQLTQFNQIYWAKVDNYVQELVKKLNGDGVLVLTGPLFLPYTAKNGKRYVSYEVIGDGNLAVPTHFFKIIYYPVPHPDPYQGGFDINSEAYLIPNKNLNENVPLNSFKTSPEYIEKISGIVLPTHIKTWFISMPTVFYR